VAQALLPGGFQGLADRKRPGRPRGFAPAVVAEAKAVACELPATRGVPLGRWSLAELRDELIVSGLVGEVSTTTLWRWLAEDPIRPWRHRSWIFPRDPAFAAKAGVALDLYERRFGGQPLGEDQYVISADEKPSVQARCRCHPTLPPGKARTMRVEHEYERRGALAYLAAWDVGHARLFGRCEPTTGIEPFGRLVEQVMTTGPYASAERVFWVVDNGSSHRGQASVDRLQDAWRNLCLVHLPIHASWLNQVEIYFSVIQRNVLSPTTSVTSSRSSAASWASSDATSRPRSPSTGATPDPTSTGSSSDWTNTSSSPRPHDDHARTCIRQYLVSPGEPLAVLVPALAEPVCNLPGCTGRRRTWDVRGAEVAARRRRVTGSRPSGAAEQEGGYGHHRLDRSRVDRRGHRQSNLAGR
jgi:hypothetical protein